MRINSPLPTPPANQPRNVDQTLASWETVPLFMKHLPTSASSASSDTDTATALSALQSLAFDGSPLEVAANFKTQADDYFRSKRYREAMGFYTQAIDTRIGENDEDDEGKRLVETLYANRAACNLELQNYAAVLKDTSKVLSLNSRNQKAYYRAIKALLALDKCQDAIQCSNHALEINPQNQPIIALKQKAHEKLLKLERISQENLERERRRVQMDSAVRQALVVRGLWLETTPCPPHNPNPVHFDDESLPHSSRLSLPLLGDTKWVVPDVVRTPLVVPVFLMYPQYAQSDFIADFHEDTSMAEYLQTIFPADSRASLAWDKNAEYYDANLQVYATTRRKRLLKVGSKLSLRQVMDQAFKEAHKGADPLKDRDGLVMRDGILSLVIVPKGEPESAWVENFKAQRQNPTLK